MTKLMAFIKRHPVATYFTLTFALSSGGILLVLGPTTSPGSWQELERLFPIALVAMIAGPSVACLLRPAAMRSVAGSQSAV